MNKASKHTAAVLKADLSHIKNTLALAARDMKKNVMNRSDELQDQLSDKISDQPFKSVAIAALSGIILGFIMRGRKHSRYRD